MPEQPIIAFADAAAFTRWLHRHHVDHPGIWMRIYKKASGQPTIAYAEALDVALCYGWIDGQKQKGDEHSWLQKFTQRRARSAWSKVNTGHAERLIRDGLMQPAGLAAITAAKADGRWDQAYHPSSSAEVPEDFLQALAPYPEARAFFDALSKSNRYAIIYRLQSAKRPETRTKRMADFIERMKRGEKFH